MVERPSAEEIVHQLKQAGVEFVINVPDRMTAAIVNRAAQEPSMKIIRVCKEDEGVSICGALSFGDKRAVLITQHTGLLDSVNSVRAVASELRRPLVIIVGLHLKEPGVKPTESTHFAVRISEPVLDILAVPHFLVERRGDEATIAALIEEAYTVQKPLAILVGVEVVPQ